ncbi:MAG TPA: hypothetical protein VN829_09940 [Dongiaceae bacterium]|nr:hypothetical protein [Dongiaceae bacterium]
MKTAIMAVVMSLLPVIERELRAASRQPLTHWLRVLGVGALLLGGADFGFTQGLGPDRGWQLFCYLQWVLMAAIWLLVPWLTADCISRERREGTLGLLFLTRLPAREIVVSKGLAHGLRALTLWLAVVPVMTVPFMLGGVGWKEVVLSAAADSSAICWALAIGLVVSAWSKSSTRAHFWATVVASLGASLWAMANGYILLAGIRGVVGRWGWWGMYPRPFPAFRMGVGFAGALRHFSWPGNTRGVAPAPLVLALATVVAMGLAVLAAAILLAGWHTRRTWQDQPPSPLRIWCRRVFCSPIFFRSWLRRRLQRKLELNPVGWLEQRTWSGRLVMRGWLATIGAVCLPAVDASFGSSAALPRTMLTWLVAGSMAFSAAGSFRRERESGVMELLLVSPLGERAVIWGRLRALWGQFFPMLGLLAGFWCLVACFFDETEGVETILLCATTFLAMPVIGLFFSLRCRHFIPAFVATLAIGLLLPMLVSAPFETYESGFASIRACATQLMLAFAFWVLLQSLLKRRAFPTCRI